MTKQDTTALFIVAGLLWILYKSPVVTSGFAVVDPPPDPPDVDPAADYQQFDVNNMPILVADPGRVDGFYS